MNVKDLLAYGPVIGLGWFAFLFSAFMLGVPTDIQQWTTPAAAGTSTPGPMTQEQIYGYFAALLGALILSYGVLSAVQGRQAAESKLIEQKQSQSDATDEDKKAFRTIYSRAFHLRCLNQKLDAEEEDPRLVVKRTSEMFELVDREQSQSLHSSPVRDMHAELAGAFAQWRTTLDVFREKYKGRNGEAFPDAVISLGHVVPIAQWQFMHAHGQLKGRLVAALLKCKAEIGSDIDIDLG